MIFILQMIHFSHHLKTVIVLWITLEEWDYFARTSISFVQRISSSKSVTLLLNLSLRCFRLIREQHYLVWNKLGPLFARPQCVRQHIFSAGVESLFCIGRSHHHKTVKCPELAFWSQQSQSATLFSLNDEPLVPIRAFLQERKEERGERERGER